MKENFDNTLGGMAIPKRRNAAGLGLAGEDFVGGGHNSCGIGADKLVGALRNSNWAFGVFAKRKARDAESGSFFLDAAGIREHERCSAEEGEKIEVTHGRDEPELGMRGYTGL